MAGTNVFVAVALARLAPNAETAVGTSAARARSFNAASTTWTLEGVELPRASDSSNREADESAVDADGKRWESARASWTGRFSSTVPPPAIASILVINQNDLAPIEPTLIISIHAPPSGDG
jgi:hypothetical protein